MVSGDMVSLDRCFTGGQGRGRAGVIFCSGDGNMKHYIRKESVRTCVICLLVVFFMPDSLWFLNTCCRCFPANRCSLQQCELSTPPISHICAINVTLAWENLQTISSIDQPNLFICLYYNDISYVHTVIKIQLLCFMTWIQYLYL